nr:CBM_6 [uncultured Clostridium sp.]
MANVSSRYHGGIIELRIDEKGGKQIGTLSAPYTGEWNNWSLQTTDVNEVTGVHDLFFVF